MALLHLDRDPVLAPEAERADIDELAGALAEVGNGTLRVEDGTGRSLPLPPSAERLVRQLVEVLAEGQAASIVSLPRELTPLQAADLLNVPTTYLLKLLDEGTIPSHQVGADRGVPIQDLLNYKARRDAERRAALVELARTGQEIEHLLDEAGIVDAAEGEAGDPTASVNSQAVEPASVSGSS